MVALACLALWVLVAVVPIDSRPHGVRLAVEVHPGRVPQGTARTVSRPLPALPSPDTPDCP